MNIKSYYSQKAWEVFAILDRVKDENGRPVLYCQECNSNNCYHVNNLWSDSIARSRSFELIDDRGKI